MDDKDLRQLNRMLVVINSFINQEINVCALTNSLFFLRSQLSEVPEGWNNNFYDEITNLEIICAILHIENRVITADEKEQAHQAAENIKQLVLFLLECNS